MHVSRETILKRKGLFESLLKHWNKSINLVQKESLEYFENRHWEDSEQIISLIHKNNPSILDLGSGGGFPGIVLAIHGFDVTLTEVVQKKIVFLKEVIRQCDLTNCRIVFDAITIKNSFDYVSARAFADLEILLNYQLNVSHETTTGIYLKGKNHALELDKALEKYSFHYKIHSSRTSKDSVIIEVTQLSRK